MRLYVLVFLVGIGVLIPSTYLARGLWPEQIAAPMAQSTALTAAMLAAWPYFRDPNPRQCRFRHHAIMSVAIPFATAAFRIALGPQLFLASRHRLPLLSETPAQGTSRCKSAAQR